MFLWYLKEINYPSLSWIRIRLQVPDPCWTTKPWAATTPWWDQHLWIQGSGGPIRARHETIGPLYKSFQGPTSPLSPPSPKCQCAMCYYGNQTSFQSFVLFHVGPGKILFCSNVVIYIHFTDLYEMTLISEVIKRKFIFSWFTVEAAAPSVIPQVSGGRPVC